MTIEMFKKEFKEILDLETNARTAYDEYIDRISDKGIKEQFVSIRDDEIRHIDIAKRLLEILS